MRPWESDSVMTKWDECVGVLGLGGGVTDLQMSWSSCSLSYMSLKSFPDRVISSSAAWRTKEYWINVNIWDKPDAADHRCCDFRRTPQVCWGVPCLQTVPSLGPVASWLLLGLGGNGTGPLCLIFLWLKQFFQHMWEILLNVTLSKVRLETKITGLQSSISLRSSSSRSSAEKLLFLGYGSSDMS